MSADTAYLDTSAVVKLLVHEAETPRLRSELRHWPRRASSALLRVELFRTIRRAGVPSLVAPARRLLDAIHLIGLDDELLNQAADLGPPSLRSLDAIHLAAAASLGDDLAALVTYDDRMAAAGRDLGLTIAAPR